MRINKPLPGLLAVAGLAFAAGHFFTDATSVAFPPPGQEREMSAEEKAWMEAGTPGKHHEVLNVLAGQWDAEFKIWMDPDQEPMVSRGTVTREWILDGRFLHETVEATSDVGTFRGIGFLGYNNIDGQYEIAWMDTMSTAIVFEKATYDPEKKILKFRGSHRDPLTGRVINSSSKVDLSDPYRHKYIGYVTGPDGKSFKHMEGTSTRK